MRKQKVVFVIDESGSMNPFQNQLRQTYAQLIQKLKAESRAHQIKTSVSLITFSTDVRTQFTDQDIETVSDKLQSYYPGGSTALYDAVMKAIQQQSPTYVKDRKNGRARRHSFLVCVLTDGQENCSGTMAAVLRPQIQDLQASDYWTFAFQVPAGWYKDGLVRSLGIHEGNVTSWEVSEEGLREGTQVLTQSLGTYYQSRAGGQSASTNFFAQVDLSKVKDKDLDKLVDISGKFRTYTVDREVPIREFVVYKTGKDYVPGSAYYQLTKTEKVRSDRKVVVQKTGEKSLYGGKEARKLIGLPDHQDAKVVPVNLNGYTLYLESRSTNRRLVRGTKLLVDVTKKTGEVPTWQPVESA